MCRVGIDKFIHEFNGLEERGSHARGVHHTQNTSEMEQPAACCTHTTGACCTHTTAACCTHTSAACCTHTTAACCTHYWCLLYTHV